LLLIASVFLQVRHPDFNYGTGEEATLAALSAFGKLSKNIRALTDLPLEITEILGVSPTFRYAEVFPPLATSMRPSKSTLVIGNCMGLRQKTGRSFLPTFIPPLEGKKCSNREIFPLYKFQRCSFSPLVFCLPSPQGM